MSPPVSDAAEMEASTDRPLARWKRYVYDLLASEISTLTRYYDRVIQWLPRRGDTGYLFESLDCADKTVVSEGEPFPDLTKESDRRTAVLLNANFNHDFDIQGMLSRLRPRLSRNSRVVVVAYNPYQSWLFSLITKLGLRQGEPPTNYVTRTDLANIARLSGFEVVRLRPVACVPHLLGLGALLNWILPGLPFLRWLSAANVITLRPLVPEKAPPSLTVVIPARNERGNIRAALTRMPDLGKDLEVIFVEGHSSDGTWEEILKVKEEFSDRFRILALQQPGKGKADAVHHGFAHASGHLLTILDADLTMPPELLGRFRDAYSDGHADFVNGTRSVYPMEGEAMRFLNRLGNIFFAKALSSVLDSRVTDSLCGTKLIARHDYQRLLRWREDFGRFDPFGDFELLFSAAVLGLGIVDVPIRYRARTYGSTNISRFRHGLILLKMTLTGLLRMKLGRPPRPRQG